MAIDRHSETWAAVEQWMSERRGDCVHSLINGSPNDDKLRGEIRAIDDLLAYASEEVSSGSEPDTDY